MLCFPRGCCGWSPCCTEPTNPYVNQYCTPGPSRSRAQTRVIYPSRPPQIAIVGDAVRTRTVAHAHHTAGMDGEAASASWREWVGCAYDDLPAKWQGIAGKKKAFYKAALAVEVARHVRYQSSRCGPRHVLTLLWPLRLLMHVCVWVWVCGWVGLGLPSWRQFPPCVVARGIPRESSRRVPRDAAAVPLPPVDGPSVRTPSRDQVSVAVCVLLQAGVGFDELRCAVVCTVPCEVERNMCDVRRAQASRSTRCPISQRLTCFGCFPSGVTSTLQPSTNAA